MFSKRIVQHVYGLAILISLTSASWGANELFKGPQNYSSGGIWASSLAVADVNGDGKPDLLVANQCGGELSCLANGTVGVLLGNGDGSFQEAQTYGSGGNSPLSIAVEDVNGDGKRDLLVGNICASAGSCDHGVVGVLLGKADGTFQPAQTYNSGGYWGARLGLEM